MRDCLTWGYYLYTVSSVRSLTQTGRPSAGSAESEHFTPLIPASPQHCPIEVVGEGGGGKVKEEGREKEQRHKGE